MVIDTSGRPDARGIQIRDFRNGDLDGLIPRLRPDDVRAATALLGCDVRTAVERSLSRSDSAWVIEIQSKVEGLAGLILWRDHPGDAIFPFMVIVGKG